MNAEVDCQHIVYCDDAQVWGHCARRPSKYVTFPRTPPIWLCAEHEREATVVLASLKGPGR